MTALRLNREFFLRHFGVAILFAGLSCWFAYDGYVTYPSEEAGALYARLHQGENAPDAATAERTKANGIARQREFALLALLASLAVGAHLFAVSRFRFAFDEQGFVWKGRRFALSDIRSVDRTRWTKKGILVLATDAGRIRLDAWHHTGVEAFSKVLDDVR